MKKLNKTNLNKLRIEHNRIVKKKYRVNPANQFRFDAWFLNNCEYGEEDRGGEGVPFFTYLEIPSHQTKSGNPYILEVA